MHLQLLLCLTRPSVGSRFYVTGFHSDDCCHGHSLSSNSLGLSTSREMFTSKRLAVQWLRLAIHVRRVNVETIPKVGIPKGPRHIFMACIFRSPPCIARPSQKRGRELELAGEQVAGSNPRGRTWWQMGASDISRQPAARTAVKRMMVVVRRFERNKAHLPEPV